MKKYLLLFLLLSFVGMWAESGWEDFGTYKKQKLVLANIDKFQLSADGNFYFTYQNAGIIKKWNVETGVFVDSLMITPSNNFFFSSDGYSAVCLTKFTDVSKDAELQIIDLDKMEISKTFGFIPSNDLKLQDKLKEFKFILFDYLKENNEVIIAYTSNGIYNYGSTDVRTGTLGRIVIFSLELEILQFKFEFSKYELKKHNRFDNKYYFIEEGNIRSNWGSTSYLNLNYYDLHNKKMTEIISYEEGYYYYAGHQTNFGYMRYITNVFPTIDSNILLIRIDKQYLKLDIISRKLIDSFQINSRYSDDNLVNNKQTLVCYDSSKFTFYNIKSKRKIDTLICPINAISYKILPDEIRIISWHKSGEVAIQNILSNEKYVKISADKYYENPNKEIKFSYFSNINPNQIEWDFGNGNKSTEEYPTHIYTNKGSYQVTLKIKDINGNWFSVSMNKKIVIKEKLKADFDFNSNSNKTPAVVSFNDKSSGEPLYYQWTTSQKDTSHHKNPIFTFTNPGFHTIKLVIWDEFQSDTVIKKDFILLDYMIPDTLSLVKEFNIPNIFTKSDETNFMISDITNSRIMLFQNNKFLLSLLYKADSPYSATKYYFNIFGILEKENFESKFKFNDTKPSNNLLANTTKNFLMVKNRVLKLYDTLCNQVEFLSTLRDYSDGFTVKDTFLLVDKNYIGIYDNNLSFLKSYMLDIEILKINAESSQELEVIGKNKDSICYQKIENSNMNKVINFFKSNNFQKNLNYKFLNNEKIAIYGTVTKSNVDLGYLIIYNKSGELVLEKEFKDITQITDIDTLNDNYMYINYKERFKNDNGIILLDRDFERFNKICYFGLDTGFKPIIFKYYKENSFFLLGYAPNSTGIKPVFLELEMNPNILNIRIDETTEERKNSLSPNPATYFININQSGIKNLKVYDLNGIELNCEAEYFENMVRVNTFMLQTGIYFVRYEINGKVYFEKFVKM